MINNKKIMALADKYARECLEDFNNTIEINRARTELENYISELPTMTLINYYDSNGMKTEDINKAKRVLYSINN